MIPASHWLICVFATAYVVSLILEATRLSFRLPVRTMVLTAVTVVGVATHSAYIGALFYAGGQTGPWGSWHLWCVLAAWLLSVVYLALLIRSPRREYGIFILPFDLALIVAASIIPPRKAIDADSTATLLGGTHGLILLAATVVMLLGAAAGVMYLYQSWRLKRALRPLSGPMLPSLEGLQRASERSIVASGGLLVAGLVSGIAHSLARYGTVDPGDPVIILSGVLAAVDVVAIVAGLVWRPARQGWRVAALTLVNVTLLGCVITLALTTRHGLATHSYDNVADATDGHPAEDSDHSLAAGPEAGR